MSEEQSQTSETRSPISSPSTSFAVFGALSGRFSNAKSQQSHTNEEHQGSQFASVTEHEEESSPKLGRSFSKRNSSFDVKRETLRNSMMMLSKDLSRPINYAYMATLFIHVIILFFAILCLGLRGDGDGYKTHIATSSLAIFQSGLNALTGLLGVIITSICAALAQRAACHRIFERRSQDLTYMSDTISAWIGPFAAVRTTVKHCKERFREGRMTIELVLVSLYLVIVALLTASFNSVFTLGVYSTYKTSDISLIPLSRVPFQETFNISSALWQVYGSTAFTAGLQNASVPGTSNGMIWDYPDLASSNYSAGISTVPATDLKVTCGYSSAFVLSHMTVFPNIDPDLSEQWPGVVELGIEPQNSNLQYPYLLVQEHFPWLPCTEWKDSGATFLRSSTLTNPTIKDQYDQYNDYPQGPVTFFTHFSCTNDTNYPPLNGANASHAAAHPLYPRLAANNTDPKLASPRRSKYAKYNDDNTSPDVGLQVSLIACSLTAEKVDDVEVMVPDGALKFRNDNSSLLVSSREWNEFTPPNLSNSPVLTNVDMFPTITKASSAPIYQNAYPGSPADTCLSTRLCHLQTVVDKLLETAIFSQEFAQNNLAGIEFTLQQILGVAFSLARSQIGQSNATISSSYATSYLEGVQFTKLTFNKWPLILGIVGAFISLVLATVLLRPLPEGSPYVDGTDLLHITRLMALSDLPEKMRDSPASSDQMRDYGSKFVVAVDRGGSTLMSERAMVTSTGSQLPIISPSATFPGGFHLPQLSFREKATPGLELEEA